MLCLGSDAPLGSPTKLLREVVFEPPEPGAVSFLYAASAELRWGPRVVAAYGDSVVLYSVPPDVFAWSGRALRRASLGAATPSDVYIDGYPHWKEWLPEPSHPNQPVCRACRRDTPWPVLIKGTIVGSLDRVVELAVHSNPDLTIWALGLDGRAAVWQVGKPWLSSSAVVRRNVNRDGLVCEGADAEGDVCMVDAEPERSVATDGHDSTVLGRRPAALQARADDAVAAAVAVLEEEAWYDEDGDVIMADD